MLLGKLGKVSVIAILAAQSIFAQKVIPLTNEPPTGFTRAQTPVFLCFGIDDNKYSDGMEWMRDVLFKGKSNPQGLGNPATYDGSPVNASFYLIGNAALKQTWRSLYDSGFEMGGHTWTHSFKMSDLNLDESLKEMFPTNKYMVNECGIPQSHIVGFRTPFLATSAEGGKTITLDAAKMLGYRYDCSLAASGIGAGTYLEGDSYYPCTLEKGFMFYNSIVVPGFWQFPHYVMATTSPVKAPNWFTSLDAMWTMAGVKAFDSGFWPHVDAAKPNTSAADFLKFLKWTLDASIRGNRAPIDIGLHSDYYAIKNTSTAPFATSVEARRQVLIDFLAYAMSKPDVRIVSHVDVLRWLTNPTALEDLSKKESYLNYATNPSENLAAATGITIVNDAKGSSGTITGSNSSLGWNWTLATPTEGLYTNTDTKVDAIIPFKKSAAGLVGLKITYQSTAVVRLRFIQEGLSEGNSFFTEFPSSPVNSTTISLRLDDFNLGKNSGATASVFEPTKVSSIALTPVLLDKGGTGTTTISELVFFGTGPIAQGTPLISVQEKKSLALNAIAITAAKGTLQFSTPIGGSITLNLSSPAGKMVYQKSHIATAGRNTIAIPQLSNGLYFLTIANDHTVRTVKIVIR